MNRLLGTNELPFGSYEPTLSGAVDLSGLRVDFASYRVRVSEAMARLVTVDVVISGGDSGAGPLRSVELTLPVEGSENFGANYGAYGVAILIAPNGESTNTGAVVSVSGTKRVKLFGNIASFRAFHAHFIYWA